MSKLKHLGHIEESLSEVEKLKIVIRLTYSTFFWIFVFLVSGSITRHFLPKFVGYAIDFSIIIATVWLWRIKRRMKKKQKEVKE